MSLPGWASPNHPLARRELGLWQKASRKWRWLSIPLLLFPLCCVGACGLTMIPMAVADNSPAAWLFTILLPFMIGLWSFHGLATFALSLFLTIGAATLIARERETRNWQLLRLTTLSLPEIVGAKTVSLFYWLRWPILGLFVLRLVVTILSVGGLAAVIYLLLAVDPTFVAPPELQLNLGLGLGASAIISTAFFLLELLISVLYNCVVGLTASSFMRTSASAVGVAFAAHLILALFVFAPAQQIVSVFLGIISINLMPRFLDSSFGPLILPLAAGVISYLVNVLLEMGVVVAGIFISLQQAQRLTE